MSRPNMQKAIKEARRIKNPRYDMSMLQMLELSRKDRIDAVCDAFNFGYIQGVKAAKAENKKGGATV